MLKDTLGEVCNQIGEKRPKNVLKDTLGEGGNQIGEKRPKNVLKDTLGKVGYVIEGSTLQICKSGS